MNEQQPIAVPETTAQRKTFLPQSMSVKSFVIIVIILLALGFGYYYRSVFVAATVDGAVVTRLAVVKKMEQQSGKAALDLLIDEKLVDKEAKARGISITEPDINGELDTIKSQLTGQGSTLDSALEAEGLTLEVLREQIRQQLEVEKLLGDKVAVSDDEITKYIADRKITIPSGQDDYFKKQIREQIKSDKFNAEAPKYLDELKAKASIKYWVNY